MDNFEENNIMLSQLEEIKGEFKNSKEVQRLSLEVSKLEVVNNALWMILQEKFGLEHADLNAKIGEILEKKKGNPAPNTVPCPNCGKKLQLQGSLKFNVKCIYCGQESIVNPFEVVERPTEEPAETSADNQPKEYNLDDDLNFDDIDSN